MVFLIVALLEKNIQKTIFTFHWNKLNWVKLFPTEQLLSLISYNFVAIMDMLDRCFFSMILLLGEKYVESKIALRTYWILLIIFARDFKYVQEAENYSFSYVWLINVTPRVHLAKDASFKGTSE